MNNWIVIRSFTDKTKCWYVRVSKLQQAARELKLELSTCECSGVPDIIQDKLNNTIPDLLYFELL